MYVYFTAFITTDEHSGSIQKNLAYTLLRVEYNTWKMPFICNCYSNAVFRLERVSIMFDMTDFELHSIL